MSQRAMRDTTSVLQSMGRRKEKRHIISEEEGTSSPPQEHTFKLSVSLLTAEGNVTASLEQLNLVGRVSHSVTFNSALKYCLQH